MTAKTIAQLKSDMPIGVAKSISATDIHNFADTVDIRNCVSVKQYGAIGTDDPANAATDTAAFLAATAAVTAAGGGSIYVPAGTYYITQGQWKLSSRTKVFGDGYNTRIKKSGTGGGFLLDISGNWEFDTPGQIRNSYCVLRDIFFDGDDNAGVLLRTYYCSELLIDKCRFGFTAGSAIDAIEWWDSRVMNCFFDWCGGSSTENPAVYLRNSLTADTGQDKTLDFGYSGDCTNAIVFFGCRFESFKSHAIKMQRQNGTSALSQIFITNCKMETSFMNGEIIKMGSDLINVHVDTLFVAINNWNTGYTTATNVIDWSPSACCSIRNVYCVTGVAGLVRSVVRCNLSVGNCTIENIWISGFVPTLAVVDFQTGTQNNIKMLGWIGGQTNSLGAAPIAKSGGNAKAISANTTAIFADDGLTYTTTSATDVTVTLPANIYPGWRVKALQLGGSTTAGRIIFAAASGGTLTPQTTGHNKTSDINKMVEIWCYENNSTLTAPKFYLSGSTA